MGTGFKYEVVRLTFPALPHGRNTARTAAVSIRAAAGLPLLALGLRSPTSVPRPVTTQRRESKRRWKSQFLPVQDVNSSHPFWPGCARQSQYRLSTYIPTRSEANIMVLLARFRLYEVHILRSICLCFMASHRTCILYDRLRFAWMPRGGSSVTFTLR